MLSRHRFCCYIVFARRVTLTLARVTHFTHYLIYNFSIYWLFLSVICIGLHSVVDILVDLNPCIPGSKNWHKRFDSRNSRFFFCFSFYLFIFLFFYFFCHYYNSANLEIQHYCLYSVSPTLLLLMMSRPPAPSALWFSFCVLCFPNLLDVNWIDKYIVSYRLDLAIRSTQTSLLKQSRQLTFSFRKHLLPLFGIGYSRW